MSGLKTGNFKDLTINSNLLIGNTIEFGINTGVTIRRDNNNNLIFNDGTFKNKTLLEMINHINNNITNYDSTNNKITIGNNSDIQFDISGNTNVFSIDNTSINIGNTHYNQKINFYNNEKYTLNVSGIDNGVIFKEDNIISSHITTGYVNSHNKEFSESYLKLGTISDNNGTLRNDIVIRGGRIGIGIENPNYKLSVDGNISMVGGNRSIYWEGTPLSIKNIDNEMYLFDKKHPSGVSIEALQKAFMDISVLNDDLFQHFMITPNQEFLIRGETPIFDQTKSLIKIDATHTEILSDITSRGHFRMTPDDVNYSMIETSGNDLFLTSSALPGGFYLKDIGDLPKGRFTDRNNQLYVIGDSSGISYFMNNEISDENKKYEIDGSGVHTFYNAIRFVDSQINIDDRNNTLEIVGNTEGVKIGVPNDSDAINVDKDGNTSINSLSMRTRLTFLGGSASLSNVGQKLIIDSDDLGMIIGKHKTFSMDGFGHVDISGAKYIRFRNTESGIFHDNTTREIRHKNDLGGIFFDGLNTDEIIKLDYIDRLFIKRIDNLSFLNGNAKIEGLQDKFNITADNIHLLNLSNLELYGNSIKLSSNSNGMMLYSQDGTIFSVLDDSLVDFYKMRKVVFPESNFIIDGDSSGVNFIANGNKAMSFTSDGIFNLTGLKELNLANSDVRLHVDNNVLNIEGDSDGIHIGDDSKKVLFIDRNNSDFNLRMTDVTDINFKNGYSLLDKPGGMSITDISNNEYIILNKPNENIVIEKLNYIKFSDDGGVGQILKEGNNLVMEGDISGTLIRTKNKKMGLYFDNSLNKIRINTDMVNNIIDVSQNMIDINYINKMKFNDSNAFIHVDTSNNQLVLNGDVSGVRIDVLGMRAALAIDSSGVVNMPTFQLDKFSEVALVNTESRFYADYPRKVSSIIGDEEGFSINQGDVVDLLRTDSLGQISINHTKGIYFDGSANIMKPDNYLTLMGDVSGIAFRVPYADSSGVYINEKGRLVIDGDFEFNKNVYRNGQEWPGLSNFWLLNDVDDLYYKNPGNVGIGEFHPKWTMDISGDLHFNGKLYHNEEHSQIHWECGNIGIHRANPYKPFDICGNMGITGTILGDRDCRRDTMLDLSDNEIVLKTHKTGIIFDNEDYTLKVGNYDMINIQRGHNNKITFNRLLQDVDFIVDSSGTQNSLVVRGNTGRIGVNTYSPHVQLDISGIDAMRIPVGTTGQRPMTSDMTGMIRYNNDIGSYEGYANNQWKDIVGNIDVDRDTFISVENNPGDDNDQINMYTSGNKRMGIDQSGNFSIIATEKTIMTSEKFGLNVADPQFVFDLSGTAQIIGDTLNIYNKDSGNGKTTVISDMTEISGNILIHGGNVDISHNATIGYREVDVTLEDDVDNLLVDGVINGDIIVYRGTTARFHISSPGEAIWIKTIQTAGAMDTYSGGLDTNGVEIGTITFDVPMSLNYNLFYVNEDNINKSGRILVRDNITRIYGALSIGNHTPTQPFDLEKNMKVGGNFYTMGKLLIGTETDVINKFHIKDSFSNKMSFMGFEFDGHVVDGEYINIFELSQEGTANALYPRVQMRAKYNAHDDVGNSSGWGYQYYVGMGKDTDNTDLATGGGRLALDIDGGARVTIPEGSLKLGPQNDNCITRISVGHHDSDPFMSSVKDEDSNVFEIARNGWGFVHRTDGKLYIAAKVNYDKKYPLVLDAINNKMGVNNHIPDVTFDISGIDAMRIPVGNTLQRPSTFDNNGLIRYNQEYKTYEGYREGQWASIVGVIDFDNDTKITADTLDHDDEDKLRFYTAGTHRAIIDNSGNFGIKTEHPQVILDINDTGAIRIPIGTDAQQPSVSNMNGLIRYNTEKKNYECYREGQWCIMVGVIDADQDTGITADTPENGDEDYLRFYTAGNETMTIQPDGNIGINKLDPSYKLHVSGKIVSDDEVRVGGDSFVYYYYSTANDALYLGATPSSGWDSGTNSSNYTLWQGLSNGNTWLNSGKTSTNTAGGDVVIATGDSRKMTIKSSGNIGIGTSAPTNNLHILTEDKDDGASILLQSDGGSGGVPQASIYFKTSSGAVDSSSSTYDSGRIYSSWNSQSDAWNNSYISLQTHGNNTSSYTDDLVVKGGQIGISKLSPEITFDINGTDGIRIPVGTTAQRPSTTDDLGIIRYNTDLSTYEGYSSGVWAGLGGVIDADQDTKITAETNVNDEDTLRFFTAGTENMVISSTGNVGVGNNTPEVSMDIVKTDGIRIPVGTTGERPSTTDDTGIIRYNTSLSTFEGYAGGVWAGLGGVIDSDQDTYISADNANKDDTDELLFYTAGVERMKISNLGTITSSNVIATTSNIGAGKTNPQFTLDVAGDINFSGSLLKDGAAFGGGGGGGGESESKVSVWEKLEDKEIQNAVSDLTFSTTAYAYNNFCFLFEGVTFTGTGNDRFEFECSTSAGILTGSIQYAYIFNQTDGTSNVAYANTEDTGTLGTFIQNGNQINGEMRINNFGGYQNSGDKYVSYEFNTQTKNSTDFVGYTGGGVINTTNKINSFKFKFENNNISAGKITLYAIKNNDIAYGDVWRKMKNITVSSSITEMEFPLDSLYQNYVLVMDSITHDGSNTNEFNLISVTEDGEITGTDYQYTINEYKSSGSSVSYFANSETNIPLGKEVLGSNMISGTLNINNKNGTTGGNMYTTFDLSTQTKLSTHFSGMKGSGLVNQTKSLLSIKLRFSGGANITGGVATLYAIKKDNPIVGQWEINESDIGYTLGKVAIGTDAPDTQLHIYGNSGLDAGRGKIKIQDISATAGSKNPTVSFWNGSNMQNEIVSNDSDGLLFKKSDGTNGLVMDTNGNVGIGTTDMYKGLTVTKDDVKMVFGNYGGGSNYGTIQVFRGLASNETPTSSSNTYHMAIQPNGGNVGIGTTVPDSKLHVSGKIIIEDEGLAHIQFKQPTSNKTFNIELGRTDGELSFRSTTGEKLRIKENGYVGIGTTNPDAPLHISSTVNGSTLGVSSRIFMRANAGTLRSGSSVDSAWHGYMFSLHTEGHIWGGVNGWIVASDERIKKNFELFDKQEAIDRINKINLYKYQYSVEDKLDYRENEYTVGFKAQEVREHHKIATGLMKEYIGDINILIENPIWEGNKLIYDIDLSGEIYTGFVKFFGCMIEDDLITETKRECIEFKDGGFLFEKKYSQVYVSGRQVNDFHNLEKDRIYALHHAGIQFLSDKCELLETENNGLIERSQILENKINQLETENNNKSQEITELKDKLQQLETENSQLKADMALVKQKLGL